MDRFRLRVGIILILLVNTIFSAIITKTDSILVRENAHIEKLLMLDVTNEATEADSILVKATDNYICNFPILKLPFFTEDEIDSILLGKADTGHIHDTSDVNNLSLYLGQKLDVSDTSDLARKVHVHDDRYYTKTDLTNGTKSLDLKSLTVQDTVNADFGFFNDGVAFYGSPSAFSWRSVYDDSAHSEIKGGTGAWPMTFYHHDDGGEFEFYIGEETPWGLQVHIKNNKTLFRQDSVIVDGAIKANNLCYLSDTSVFVRDPELDDYYTKTNLQTSGQSSVHWGNVINAPSFITGVNWNEIGGDQSLVNVSGFNNDAGYLTSLPSSSQDWNTNTNVFNTSSVNGPLTGSVVMGINVRHNLYDYAFQINGRNNRAWIRTKESGVWGNSLALFHEGHYPTWDEIESKPTVFSPDDHDHDTSDVNSLSLYLDQKLDVADTSDLARKVHGHDASDITSGTLSDSRLSFNPDYFVQGENSRRSVEYKDTNPMDNDNKSGFFTLRSTDPAYPSGYTATLYGFKSQHYGSYNYTMEIAGDKNSDVLLFGGLFAGIRQPWREIWHSGNLNPDYFVQGETKRRSVEYNVGNRMDDNNVSTFVTLRGDEPSSPSSEVMMGFKTQHANRDDFTTEIVGRIGTDKLYFGGLENDVRQPWREIWHSGNLDTANIVNRTDEQYIYGTKHFSHKLYADGGVYTTYNVGSSDRYWRFRDGLFLFYNGSQIMGCNPVTGNKLKWEVPFDIRDKVEISDTLMLGNKAVSGDNIVAQYIKNNSVSDSTSASINFGLAQSAGYHHAAIKGMRTNKGAGHASSIYLQARPAGSGIGTGHLEDVVEAGFDDQQAFVKYHNNPQIIHSEFENIGSNSQTLNPTKGVYICFGSTTGQEITLDTTGVENGQTVKILKASTLLAGVRYGQPGNYYWLSIGHFGAAEFIHYNGVWFCLGTEYEI